MPDSVGSENREPDVDPISALDSSGSGQESEHVSDAEVSELVAPAVPAQSLVELKQYCDQRQLKCEIDLSGSVAIIAIEMRNGRTSRTVYLSEEDSAAVLGHPLEEIVFLGNYSAVCCYRDGWIEASIRPHGGISAARRSIFGLQVPGGVPGDVEIPGPRGLTLRLTEKRGILSLIDYSAPIYLRIEGVGVTQHDAALSLLEDLSNSLFMQIDFRSDAALTLTRDRLRLRTASRSRRKLEEDSLITYPRHSYEKSPSSLYWYGRSATSMPLLQFLAFYQCIEFFFSQYSRLTTIARMRNILKNPAFDGSKDNYLNTLLNAALEGRKGAFLEERRQLGATLKECVDSTALLDFLNESEERKTYFSTQYKLISAKKISLSDESVVVEQTADRVYDLRCKIVHTKNLEGGGGEDEEMILPFSREADLLGFDVELVMFLARKVLIASSAPLAPY